MPVSLLQPAASSPRAIFTRPPCCPTARCSSREVITYNGSNFVILASAELYDPATGTWTPTGSLNDARYWQTATLLTNGQVLVAGGANNNASNNGVLASAELYDPATGTWTPTASMGIARYNPTATLLPNGKVLVAAGFGTTAILQAPSCMIRPPALGRRPSSATARCPAANCHPAGQRQSARRGRRRLRRRHFRMRHFSLIRPPVPLPSPVGCLDTARDGHTATLLPNGKVLVAGGVYSDVVDSYGTFLLSSAELYDPATGHWTDTGSMGTARFQHTATLLANGKVLVAGVRTRTAFLPARSCMIRPPAFGHLPAASTSRARVIPPRCCPMARCSSREVSTSMAPTTLLCASAELYNPGVSLPNPVKLGDGSFQFGFINGSGPIYSVLASTNLSATVNAWTNLGAATEMPVGSGLFQFTDHQAPNYPQRFYRVSSP